MSIDSPIIVALDFANAAQAKAMAETLDPALCRVKIGKELFTREGPAVVRAMADLGYEVFLDLKFHDIPNTVAAAVSAAAELGVWMVNVHASGGPRMMQAARDALETFGSGRPLLTAVTVLTSMTGAELRSIGIQQSPLDYVSALANLACECGLDGVVCSAEEVTALRKQLPANFSLVTPGIRPAHSSSDDQRRIATPRDAIQAGSDYLVIGRPITRSEDPAAALKQICSDLR